MCVCNSSIRSPYCGSQVCKEAKERAQKKLEAQLMIPQPSCMRFEYGDEVIVKRNGTVIGEGRVQEEIGNGSRTAAVVKFEQKEGRPLWADVCAADGKQLTQTEVRDLMRVCLDNGANFLVKRLVDLL